MVDTFQSNSAGLQSPGENIAAVTPNDGADLAYVTRAIMVNVSGVVTFDPSGTEGDTTVSPTLAANVVYSFRAKRIRATGTTATGIVAIW